MAVAFKLIEIAKLCWLELSEAEISWTPIVAVAWLRFSGVLSDFAQGARARTP